VTRTNKSINLNAAGLTCEYAVDPLGIDVIQPRFGWVLQSNERGQMQSAYQILVAGSEEQLLADNGEKWDSGKTDSDRSANIEYQGKPLASGEKCYWKVRFWDAHGRPSPWSEPGTFEMGLLEPGAWKAQWIGMNGPEAKRGSPLVRKEIEITGRVKRARVYMSGLGWSELYINGEKVSDDVLSPGLSDYSREIQYCTYDVTTLLKQGKNAIGMMLGNGWFSAANILSWEKEGGWADRPQALLQMIVTYDNGTKEQIYTDETWRTAGGAITANQKNPGEEYDARQEKPQWNRAGYDDREWSQAAVISPSVEGRLTCRTIPPIKVQDSIRPITLTKDGAGGWVFEFDRYFSGWVRLNVTGTAGTKISMTYEEGERDTYILKGAPEGEIYEPRFTFHPVRHVRVEGLEGTPTLDTLTGREVYSDVNLYGDFTCSNELLNRIHGNI